MMNMKKIVILCLLILITGCTLNRKSPQKSVEKYFMSYQKLDSYAQNNIDRLVENEETLTFNQKEKYKSILKNHYKNLKYKIKKVKIINNNATVLSEIEVNNNIRVLEKAEDNKTNFAENNQFSIEKFNDYIIDMLKKEKSKIKYEVLFNLHIENNDWIIDDLSLSNQEKMLGIYKEYF